MFCNLLQMAKMDHRPFWPSKPSWYPACHAAAAAGCNTCTVKPIAADEGEYLRWNADPFDLDGGSGTSEADPGHI